MIVARFPPEYAARGMADSRKFCRPLDEEWQADGTWTGLFDIAEDRKEEFYERIEAASDGEVQTKEIESKDEIVNHRMTFLFTSDQMAAELAKTRENPPEEEDA